MNPLANWNENCKNAVTKARNAMHNNKTLENNCINYRRLKVLLKAQHVTKSTAREYWQDFSSTLHKSTKLGPCLVTQQLNGKGQFWRCQNSVIPEPID